MSTENNAERLNISPVMISPVSLSFSLIVSCTTEDMVIRSLSISCFLLDDLLTLIWVFSMSWDHYSRSGQCVGHGYEVGGECVGRGYPFGGGGSWLLSVSSSPCTTVSLSTSWSEIILIGFGDAPSC